MRKKCLRAAALAVLLAMTGCQQEEPDHQRVSGRFAPPPPPPPRHYGKPLPPPPKPGYATPAPNAHPSRRYSPLTPAQPRQPARSPAYAGIPKSWYPRAAARSWRWIVIHHSDTEIGSAATFDRYHRKVHGWDSLGYDFVIGNGRGSADGQVEVGSRWTNQATGAHAGVREYNEYGIGICLVGDFQSDRPSMAQLQSLARLNAFLMRTYRIPAKNIIGHHDVGRKTTCPGRNMSLATVRTMAQQLALAPVDEMDFLFYAPLAQADSAIDLLTP